MKSQPLVSVLMANYNNEVYLSEAIESVLNQTYINFELLIVDDCSQDNSWSVIKQYADKDKRIKPFKNKKNLGIAKTRNKLFDVASKKSKYYAIMDSDDISNSKRIKNQVEFLEKNSDYGIVGNNLIIIDENSNEIGRRKYHFNVEKVKLIKSPFPQPSVMIRKKALGNLRYPENYQVCEDWYLWLLLLSVSKGKNLDFYGLKYRVSTTQSKTKKLKLTILNSIKIKFKFMKFKDYLNIKIIFRIFLELSLLLLPKKLILVLFHNIELKNGK